MNNRISINDNNTIEKPFNMIEQINSKNTDNYEDTLKYIQTDTILSKVFFSKENIKMLQNMLRYNIWLQSDKKYIISDQDELQLTIIMRSIFLQYSKNLPNNIKEQVKKLNGYVLDSCIPGVLSQVQQFIQYKKDISETPKPLEYGKYVSTAGTKTLNLDNFI